MQCFLPVCCREVRRLQELRRIIQEECDSLLLRKERLKEEVGLVGPWSLRDQQHPLPVAYSQQDHMDVWAGRHDPPDQPDQRHAWAGGFEGEERPGPSMPYRHAWSDQQHPHVVGHEVVVAAAAQCDAWTQVPLSETDQDYGTASEALSDVARAYKVEVWFGKKLNRMAGHVVKRICYMIL
jgi:hypothetical protein